MEWQPATISAGLLKILRGKQLSLDPSGLSQNGTESLIPTGTSFAGTGGVAEPSPQNASKIDPPRDDDDDAKKKQRAVRPGYLLVFSLQTQYL